MFEFARKWASALFGARAPVKKRPPQRVLFILKRNEGYGGSGPSSGLLNSARYCLVTLQDAGIGAHLVEVTDNNDIDREITKYRPTVVIIEALWVVPEKFDVLKRLHPGVEWIVRIHSEVPFLAQEGIAMAWIIDYWRRGLTVAVNSRRCQRDLWRVKCATRAPGGTAYLPNCYVLPAVPDERTDPRRLNIGCFGAIRPMKNQLEQAICAIHFANNVGLPLDFHINAARVETGGENPLRNIRELFRRLPRERFRLVEHGWESRRQFLDTLAMMDLCLQVSMTESFNLVTADAIAAEVPVVTSPEISWSAPQYQARPTDSSAILAAMHDAYENPCRAVQRNLKCLEDWIARSTQIWVDRFS